MPLDNIEDDLLSQQDTKTNVDKIPIFQRQCPVCRKLSCPLRSHRAFAARYYQQRQRQDLPHAPVHQIDDEKANPFARHPIRMSPELQRLYAQGWSRWNSDFAGPERHLFPISRYSAMFRDAWHDKALHFGVLSVVATQVSILRDGQVDQLALKLQFQAVVAQRAALLQGPPSDARVMTALCIMSNDFAVNKSEDMSGHLQLIAAWVQRKGGLDYLGMEGIIADNLKYADCLAAALHNQQPRYRMHLPPVSHRNTPEMSAAYIELEDSGFLQRQVVSIASHYLVLIDIFDRAAKRNCSSSEATYFGYLANVVEFELACANERLHDTNTLDECIVLAFLLVNHTLLRNYGQVAPCIPIFEARYWRCLDQLRSSLFFFESGLTELECFLVSIGTIISVRRPSPFMGKTTSILAELRRVLGNSLQEFGQLCHIMEKYGWSESVCSKLYLKIWNDSSSVLVAENHR